jgi:hypothetical protein
MERLKRVVRYLTEATVVDVFESLNYFCLSVHHEGAICNNGFVDGLATQQENFKCTVVFADISSVL